METITLTVHEAGNMEKILCNLLENTKKEVVQAWNDPDLGRIYDTTIKNIKNAPLTGTMMYLGQSAMQIELFGGMLETTKFALNKAATKEKGKTLDMILIMLSQIRSQTGELAETGYINASTARDLLVKVGVHHDYWKFAVPVLRSRIQKTELEQVDAIAIANSVKDMLPFEM